MTPDLAAFASKEPSATGEEPISLKQVAARKTSISWVEALACVQQISHAVITGEQGSLDESSIYLHRSGRISIEASGETSPEDAVQFFGNLLGTWLEGTPHPTALDTILRAAAASPPGYSSVAEFAAALKPYARPDRAKLVRAVFDRAGGPISATQPEPAVPIQTAPIPIAATVEAVPPAVPEIADQPAATVEAVAPAVLSFTRSRSRTPYIEPDAAPTSTLINHQSEVSVDQPTLVVSARPSAKDIAGEIKKRVVAAFDAFAERLRPVLQAVLAFLSAIPSRMRPLAKPLAVFAIAALAVGAAVVSGRLLVTTVMNPSEPAASKVAPPAVSKVAPPAATPAATSKPEAPVAKIADARPVAPARNAAPPRNPAPSNVVPASKAPVTTAAPTPAPASSNASLSERATAAVTRAFNTILPPPIPRRTTSIVLEPDPGRRRAAAPSSARAASATAQPTPSSPSAAAVSAPSESSSPIELQAAAPPVVPEASQLSSAALPGAVMPKYPMPPPAPIVYSSDDADVVPPVQTYPRYVEALPPNHPNASPFQIVVDENGLVESAVLARYPTDMRQAVSGTMLLAAAKAWRFQPATKDGRPVKYRRIIWFSNQ